MPHLKTRKGQGLVEYIILITLMGIVLIAVVKSLGNKTKDKFRDAADQVGQL